LAGCDRSQIRVYQAAKDVEAPPPAASAASRASAAIPSLKWETLPQGWKDLGTSSRTRLAAFSLEGDSGQVGEVSVIALPGMGENDLEFVNMWRQQIGLPEVKADELGKYRSSVQIAGGEGKLFDMKASEARGAADGNSVLVALAVRDGVSFFFKLGGPEALVNAQRSPFTTFLKGVSFGPAAEASPRVAATGGGEGRTRQPTWDVPAGWSQETPGPMVLAKFTASGEGATRTDITVSSFPGDVGGLLANVNRWREQVRLGPITEAALAGEGQTLELPDGKATVVDVTGSDSKTGKPARLVGVVVPRKGETWFYKMMGDSSVTGREKPGLLKFVQSAKHQ